MIRERASGRRIGAALATAAFLCSGGAAPAQQIDYVEPGSLAAPVTPTKQRLEEGSDKARWSIGRLRLQPQVWIRDLAYLDNVYADAEDEQQVSDFSLTLGVGLVSYLNLGPKVTLSGFVRPEYSWWQEQEDLRRFDSSFGLGLFGFFNRLTVSVDARRLEREELLSSELEVPVTKREERGRVALELEVRERLTLFASFTARSFEASGRAASRAGTPGLQFLERDEEVARAGARLSLGEHLRLGLGIERLEADFPVDPGSRSHSGSGPLLLVEFRGRRLDADLSVVRRSQEFVSGSSLEEFDRLTGSLGIGHRADLRLYTGQALHYSGLEEESIFTGERYGLALNGEARTGLRLRAFVEIGEDDFEGFVRGGRERVDDYGAWGGGVALDLRRDLVLDLSLTRTLFDSTQPEFDRSATSLRAELSLGGDLLPWL